MTKHRHFIIFSGIAFATIGAICFFALFPFNSHSEPPVIPQLETPTGTTTPQTDLATTLRADDDTSSNSASAEVATSTVNNVAVQSGATTPTFTTQDGTTYPLRTYKPLAAPNDPYATQWWTDSTGMELAWSTGAGARATVVAVIDTGFGLQHEDLSGRWATNASEQGTATIEAASYFNCTDRTLALNQSCNVIDDDYDGVVDNEIGITTQQNPSRRNCTDQAIPLDKACNLIDDDSNGYVDDVTGWDFASYDSSVQTGQINPDGVSTQHGTEVSGVLAATGNNSKGMAGVNWTTDILPLQAIDDDGYGNTLTVARAIYYATNRNVDVINLSLGTEGEDAYLRQAVHYALDNGTIVVASSGNDGCNCMSYPANYPEVVAVGAQNPTGTPASFSSYGSNLDILAPGENMTTATWTKNNLTSAYVSGIAGTSFAAPYISGLLSLARSHHPDASWAELTHALRASADHASLTAAQPVSTTLGSGYAQADRFMTRLITPRTPGMRYQFGPLVSAGTLGSTRAHQCRESGDFPATWLYEITTGNNNYYTLDTLAYVRAQTRGDTVKKLWYSCVGLPGDQPSTLRTINLFSEIKNNPAYKPAL